MKAIPILLVILLVVIIVIAVIGVLGGFECGETPMPTPTPTPTPTTSPTPTPVLTATPATTGTPIISPTPTLTPPIVTDISPDTFHQGETFRFTFSLKNQSPLLYENVYVFCHSVSNNGETWIQPMPGWSNEVTLAPDATAEVTVDAITGSDQPLGEYTLEYHVRYKYNGTVYPSEHQYYTVSVTAANDDIRAKVSPDAFNQGESGQFTFLLQNYSTSLYEDVYIFCYSVDKEGDSWIQPVNQASEVVTIAGGETAEVTVDAVTSSDQPTGDYTLSYYIHFTGEGDKEFETHYTKIVTVE